MANICNPLCFRQSDFQMAGNLQWNAGRGPHLAALPHVKGQADVLLFQLLHMSKPASNSSSENVSQAENDANHMKGKADIFLFPAAAHVQNCTHQQLSKNI